MAQPTLLLAALSAASVATAYALVGARLARGRRAASPEDRALRMFVLWWLTTALNQILGGALYAAAAFGHVDFALQVTYVVVQRFLLAVSMVGLMAYLVYLLFGREPLRALVLVYAAFFAFQVYSVFAGRPDGVEIHPWRVDLHPTAPPNPVLPVATFVWLVLPPVAGAVGLGVLARRIDERSRRIRAFVVSAGLATWWVVAVIAGQRAALDVDAIQILNRAVGVCVALGILLSYQPTGWLQRRFGLEPYGAGA